MPIPTAMPMPMPMGNTKGPRNEHWTSPSCSNRIWLRIIFPYFSPLLTLIKCCRMQRHAKSSISDRRLLVGRLVSTHSQCNVRWNHIHLGLGLSLSWRLWLRLELGLKLKQKPLAPIKKHFMNMRRAKRNHFFSLAIWPDNFKFA